MEDLIKFDSPIVNPSIIKVVGVGGGGGNAVTHMFNEGIKDVTFMLCNTDNQALWHSPVPNKLQLGKTVTMGLGAGNKPEIAREAAKESEKEIRDAFSDGTKMVFITAGMGGGTGTGAAPVIAGIAKSMGILTVGIITLPFRWEGNPKIDQALDGLEAIKKNVDALLVINNELLGKIYPDLTVMNGFRKADDTLTTAAKSIAEIITVEGYINLDFADVNTVMRDGGVAIMSTGYAEGDQRLSDAFHNALHSPLLNNNDVFSAKKVLFNISCSSKAELKMMEMDQIYTFMSKFEPGIKLIWGISYDDSLNSQIKVTLLASGYDFSNFIEASQVKILNPEEEDKRINEERNKELRRSQFYSDTRGGAFVYRKYSSYVLNDFDAEDEITIMETIPSYLRKGLTKIF